MWRSRFPLPPSRCLALAALTLTAASSEATQIQFVATDLADTTMGEDLWQYSYTVSDYVFDTDYGFTIFFDHSLYSNLESPPPTVNADWDVISIQPDTLLPAPGFYDGLALANSASLANPFTVAFVWLGEGDPGSQPFVIYEPGFATIETGTTVPEPSSAALVALGVLGVGIWRRLH